MSVINYGAKFVDDGLKCDECGNEVRQILAYDAKQYEKKIEL